MEAARVVGLLSNVSQPGAEENIENNKLSASIIWWGWNAGHSFLIVEFISEGGLQDSEVGVAPNSNRFSLNTLRKNHSL